MFRTILVPLDGSAFGEHALPFACTIAQRASATLLLTQVHLPVMPLTSEVAAYTVELDLEQRDNQRRHVQEIATRLANEYSIRVDSAVLDAPIAPALHDYAIEQAVDLIIMTTHGRGPLSRVWLGSTADRMVRTMPIPIVLIRPHDGEPLPTLQHMLIPLDGSELGEQIIPAALMLGSLTEARYTLLQVIEPSSTHDKQPMLGDGVDQFQKVRGVAQSYLDDVGKRLSDNKFQVNTAVVVGHPAAAILEYAHANAVDLIAMETHGRGGLMRLMLGSVADKVARGATSAILLQRPQSEV
jgi:nucleotide-binding universal stress UspA family protein